ncbi:MAG: sugar transferase [Alphaproteobacteria bacterium]|nr:sugar transferase [Alphaproteobacteria bacterium]
MSSTELLSQLSSKNRFSAKSMLTLPAWVTAGIILFDLLSFIVTKYIAADLYFFIRTYIIPSAELDINSYSPHPSLHLVLGLIVSLVIWNQGLYTNRTPWWSQVRLLTKVVLFAFIVHGFLSFSLKVFESRLFILLYWAMVYGLMLGVRVAIFKLARHSKDWDIPAVIVSDPNTAEDLIFAFGADLSTGYKVKELFIRSSGDDNKELDISGTALSTKDFQIIDERSIPIEQFIRNHPQKFYIISLDAFRDAAREDIIKVLNEEQAMYAIVPSLSRANLYQMEPQYFFGHDVVMLHVRSTSPYILKFSISRGIKRGMDIAASGLALMVAGPVILALGACLKLEGQGGSIFYGGKRIGKNGELFNCWKLRSMEPDSNHLLTEYLEQNPELKQDWETFRKLPRDPRVTTRTARLIRKLSLDELPQLWNIFVGDMSLVGPRPILEDETGYFNDQTLKDYLSIRPGLTGLWQVSGRNKTSFKRRVYWDSWYVRNWSLWGDIIILIKTPLVLLTRKGAS